MVDVDVELLHIESECDISLKKPSNSHSESSPKTSTTINETSEIPDSHPRTIVPSLLKLQTGSGR